MCVCLECSRARARAVSFPVTFLKKKKLTLRGCYLQFKSRSFDGVGAGRCDEWRRAFVRAQHLLMPIQLSGANSLQYFLQGK